MTERDELLTPAEVAQMLDVRVKTVTGWARAGKLSQVHNVGGDMRFRASDVRHLSDADIRQGE
jgi:excisionase family DNA binding protein